MDFYTKLRLRNEVKNAILSGVKTLHFENFEPIKLPRNQNAGTLSQRLFYAENKASELVSKLIKS